MLNSAAFHILCLLVNNIDSYTMFGPRFFYFGNYVQHEILGTPLGSQWYIVNSTFVVKCFATTGNFINDGLSNKGIQLSQIKINQETCL